MKMISIDMKRMILNHQGNHGSSVMRLEKIVREKCQQYLVNMSSFPIAESCYRRLLTWTACNDTVWYLIAAMNVDCTTVSHDTIHMSDET